MSTFWPHAAQFVNWIYPGTSLKTNFVSPGKPWNLVFASPGKLWKTVFYCQYKPRARHVCKLQYSVYFTLDDCSEWWWCAGETDSRWWMQQRLVMPGDHLQPDLRTRVRDSFTTMTQAALIRLLGRRDRLLVNRSDGITDVFGRGTSKHQSQCSC